MTDPKVDSAAEAVGRIAGTTVNALGLRLLRWRAVRQALERAGQEARADDDAGPPPHDPPHETHGFRGDPEAGGGGPSGPEGAG